MTTTLTPTHLTSAARRLHYGDTLRQVAASLSTTPRDLVAALDAAGLYHPDHRGTDPTPAQAWLLPTLLARGIDHHDPLDSVRQAELARRENAKRTQV